MNSIILVAIVSCLAIANAGTIVASSAKIIQAPNTRTTISGPDGGLITQEATPGIVAEGPLASLQVEATAPVVRSQPYYWVPQPEVIVPANLLAERQLENTIIAGPSGTISTTRTVQEPHLSVPHLYPGHLRAAPFGRIINGYFF